MESLPPSYSDCIEFLLNLFSPIEGTFNLYDKKYIQKLKSDLGENFSFNDPSTYLKDLKILENDFKNKFFLNYSQPIPEDLLLIFRLINKRESYNLEKFITFLKNEMEDI